MVQTKDELIDSLIDRDGITYAEAANIIDEVQDEINYIIGGAGTLEELEDLLRVELGLEPDYLPLFLEV